MSILKTESYRRGILYSTLLNIISKGLVFVNSLVVAYFFGTQLKTDIYFYTYNTIVILSAFITSLNASVLIPESMRIRIQEGNEKAIGFLNLFIYGYVALTVLFVLFFLIDPVHIFQFISSFELNDIRSEKTILLFAVPLIMLMPLVNLLTEVMGSYKFFTVPMLAGIINGVFSVSFVLLFHNILDILSLVLGLISAYSINLGLLVYLMTKKLSWNFRVKRMHIEKRIWRNIGFAQAGNLTSSLCLYAPLYLLSGFGAGIITSFNYAQQISSLPSHLIIAQFSNVVGIKFNEQHAKADFQALNKTFVSTSGFLLFILFPVSGIMFLYPTEIVTVLLKRGAFSDKGVEETALFLQYLGIMPPLLALNALTARLFMAAHKIMESFWYQVLANIMLIVLMFFMVKLMGPIGYPISLVTLYTASFFCVYFLKKRYFQFLEYIQTIKFFLKTVLVNLIILLPLYWFTRQQHYLPDMLMAVTGSFVYVILILVIGIKLNISREFNEFIYTIAGRYTNIRLKKKEIE